MNGGQNKMVNGKKRHVAKKDWSSRVSKSLWRKHKETSQNLLDRKVDEMEVKH
jgi:hypothetical protein